MKPSPGPWGWAVGKGMTLTAADDKRILQITPGAVFDGSTDDTTLIAAAPEMREMLLKLDDGVTECPFCSSYALASDLNHASHCALGALLERIR